MDQIGAISELTLLCPRLSGIVADERDTLMGPDPVESREEN
jgi:hypothetical protein